MTPAQLSTHSDQMNALRAEFLAGWNSTRLPIYQGPELRLSGRTIAMLRETEWQEYREQHPFSGPVRR